MRSKILKAAVQAAHEAEAEAIEKRLPTQGKGLVARWGGNRKLMRRVREAGEVEALGRAQGLGRALLRGENKQAMRDAARPMIYAASSEKRKNRVWQRYTQDAARFRSPKG